MKLCAPARTALRSFCQTLPDGVSPNTEGGQTADGRWNGPTNFGHLIGDLLDMTLSRRHTRRCMTLAPGPDSGPSPWKGRV